MKQRPRRLWFGDWQRDAADPDAADTFVVMPDEETPSEEPVQPPRNVARVAAIVAVALAAFALALALSSGGDDNRRTPAPLAQTPRLLPQVPQTQVPQGPRGFGGPDLTGPSATQAARAALARYPGDIERVTRGVAGSGYVVHVIQADGSEVHVVLSDEFKILGSDAGRGSRGFGRPGNRSSSS
jgi:hypothetical protein